VYSFYVFYCAEGRMEPYLPHQVVTTSPECAADCASLVGQELTDENVVPLLLLLSVDYILIQEVPIGLKDT
jgi:hypothetical protein